MSQKWFGTYRAVVVDLTDPKKLDRVRVRVPEVLGDTITDWVWPKHPAPHWSWKPRRNENVWVEFESGDVDRPLYSGTWYPQVDGESSIPTESKDEYPFHRMIKTPDGHKIEFKDISTDEDDVEIDDSTRYLRVTSSQGHVIEMDDTKDDEHINIEHSDGKTKIAIDKDGNIEIESNTSGTGNKITFTGPNGTAFPLAGVVTKNHICSFTGSPHPQGSLDVEATG